MSETTPNPDLPGRIVQNQRWRSGMPLGGLGCGKIELLTDGALGNFTGNNNWERATGVLRGTFFAIKIDDQTTLLRLKRPGEYDGVANVSDVESNFLFPRGFVHFEKLPVDVSLEAFSPLIPHDPADSALPVAFFEFTLQSREARTVSLMFSWENLVGVGGRRGVDINERGYHRQEPVVLAPENPTTPAPISATSKPATGEPVEWSGLRFLSEPVDKPLNVFGEHLILSDGPIRVVKHWDPAAGMISREVTLEADKPRTVRFAAVWFMPHCMTEWAKRHKETDRLIEADARAVLDGDPDTRWMTESPSLPGEQLILDLGEARPLDKITVDNGGTQGDFTCGFTLDSSTNGQTWEAVAHKREAVRNGVAEFSFSQRSARYYRVNQTRTWPELRWHVAKAEGSLDGKAVQFVKATGRIHPSAYQTVSEDVGHYYLNQFTDAAALARYATADIDRLHKQTCEWHDLILASSLPGWLKVMLTNHTFPAFTNSILTKDGRFSVLESPEHMFGALGTMDQRQASHAFWTMMFPDLDRTELELYAAGQDRVEPVADGRIPHFCGNIHHSVGDPTVEYGVPDWPDLSCSWIMQVAKWYRWTDDEAFARRMWPHVQKAIAWMQSVDTDGDLIPEGGSTYDYEQLPRGGFIFTASVYLGALRAASDMAQQLGEPDPYADLFKRVQQGTIERLYDKEQGTFIKWRNGDQTVKNSFVAALAGDWLVRLTGLEPIFPAEINESAMRALLARHLKSFYPIPPMEVTPEGKCFTNICFVLQHEPYLGCEAIYQGYVEDGLEVHRRIYEAAWDLNWSPWNCPLNIESPHGRQSWLLSYMTNPAVWHILPALSGTTLNLPRRELIFRPTAAYHGPLFFPTFWGWLDCEPGSATVKVLKVFSDVGTAARVNRLKLVNGVEKNLDVRAGALWDLSEFAKISPSKTVAARFPTSQPQHEPKPWHLRSSDDRSFDIPLIETIGAIDGDPQTCWWTRKAMQPGDWLQVDLLKEHDIHGLRFDHRAGAGEHPRGLRIEVSTDGQTWRQAAELSEPQVLAALKEGILIIPFEAKARYIKLTQLGQARARWSIYDLDLE